MFRSSSSRSLALLAVCAAPSVAQTEYYRVDDQGPSGQLGFSIATGYDLNNDGVQDFLAGRPQPSSNNDIALLYSGATGELIQLFLQGGIGGSFGASVAMTGDLNGDGISELLIGAPGAPLGQGKGAAYLYDGVSFGLLTQLSPAAAGEEFGQVAPVGDVNGNGSLEFAVADPREDIGGKVNAGVVRIYEFNPATNTASVVRQYEGDLAFDELGWALADGRDVNQDGLADLLVGAPVGDVPIPGGAVLADAGYARLYSGTGATLGTFQGTSNGGKLATSVELVDDYDGDGLLDVAVGEPEFDLFPFIDSGRVQLFSSASQLSLGTVNGAASDARLGVSMGRVDDTNGDGVGELLVGLQGAAQDGGVQALSGADLSLLFSLPGGAPMSFYGDVVRGTGDLNGDGAPEFLVAEPMASPTGEVHVFSSEELSLFQDFGASGGSQHVISGTAGGTQSLKIQLGAGAQGKLFVLLGSLQTSGLSIGALDIPLALDGYFTFVLANPGQVFAPSNGLLAAGGTASTSVSVPAGTTIATTLTLYHAVVAFDLGTMLVTDVTNNVPLTLRP